MAIFTSIIGAISGKIGGLVFSRNKGGAYFKAHSIPTNPNSTRQQATRNWLAYCATYWGSELSESERDQWRTWAEANTWTNALGAAIALTGAAWFSMVNSRLLDAGASIIDTPGDLSAPDALTSMSITDLTATQVEITFAPALPSGGRLQVWAAGPLNDGQDPNFRQATLVGYTAADAASPATLTLPWTVASGQSVKCFVGIMNAKGRVSTKLVDSDTYTP